jgi:hypothetical protein
MIDLFVLLSPRKGPGVVIHVAMREHGTSTELVDVAKVTALTPLTLLILCEFSFLIVSLKVSSLHTFALKSPNKFSYCT